MGRQLIFVRHAAPRLDADLEPAQWELSPAGRSAARALGDALPVDATYVSSTEIKALQTLEAAGRKVHAVDAAFGEVRRPPEAIDDEALALRREWFAGRLDGRHVGWESPADAAERFAAGLSRQTGSVIVVATHGMVLTAWLVTAGHVPGAEAAEFWSRLRCPEVVRVPGG